MVRAELITTQTSLSKLVGSKIQKGIASGLAKASRDIVAEIKKSFANEGDRGLGPWKPTSEIARLLRKNPASRSKSAPTLVDTGQYKDSFTLLNHFAKNNKIGLELGSPLESIAKVHEYGGQFLINDDNVIDVPQRRAHYLTQGNINLINKSIVAGIKENG